ncbi:MAG: MarC family protein [Bacteroidetes bacterium]|nr:MarC family protein [Bacteroidota bacterium]MBU1113691.1 MarC family protein [Bacteroidota bacterium]MBU1799090.1 MarC family protein [Bacteroidota bacterium]
MIEELLLYITSLFTMINPLGVVPLFISLTDSFTPSESRRVAIKASVISFITLTLFALTGKILFDFFGISVDGLKVIGGILFFIMGYEMLRGRTVPKKMDNETNSNFGKEVAITPIAIPMITGPGSITMVIILMQSADSIFKKAEIISAIFVVTFLTAIILISGRKLMSFLGPSGSNVLMRLMGLIVMLIAVEFFFSGITPYIYKIVESIP